MLKGLRTVVCQVPDLTAAKTWYSKVLGKAPYFDEPFYVGFEVGGYELGLDPRPEGIAATPGNVVTYWAVDDARAAYQDLLNAGAQPHAEPMDVGEGIVVASVLDPWGNPLGVIVNPHFQAK